MPIVLIQIPEKDVLEQIRPSSCPNCGSKIIHSWGQSSRNIQDTKPTQATVHRYYCEACQHTFRYYPKSIDRSNLTHRIRRLAALIWLLGLSTRDVVELFSGFGVTLNRMTVWREGQELVDLLNTLKMIDPSRIFLIFQDKSNNKQNNGQVMLALEMGQGKLTVLGTLNEPNPRAVISWLKPILKEVDIQVSMLATEELQYREITNSPPSVSN